MPRIPRLKGKEVVSVLKKFGFEVTRIKGSHHILKHPDGRSTVVPVHSGEIIGPGLLSKMLRDCEMSIEEFCQLIR